MSDTPETDAVIKNVGDGPYIAYLVHFARKLERERDEARRELDAVEALLEEYDHRFNCSESWSQSDTLGKVDFLIKGYIILHGDSLIQRRKRNE